MDISELPKAVRDFIEEKAKICLPDRIVECDGSEEEFNNFTKQLQNEGVIVPLKKLNNW